MISKDSRKSICLPDSEAGRARRDLPVGRMIGSSGPQAPHASPSASQALELGLRTSGIFGLTFTDLPKPAGPLSLWESKLRQRLARIGSTECFLTWKASVTPAGRSLSRLVPSTPRIVEIEPGLSLDLAYWITATTRDWKDSAGMTAQRSDGKSRIDQLPRQVAAILHPTPTASLADKGIRSALGARTEVERGRSPDLDAVVKSIPSALFATPTSLAPAKNGQNEAGNSAGLVAIRAAVMPGIQEPGLSAMTEKPGAFPSLNPAFVCWLMGYPQEWVSCAPSAMPSSRKLRPRS